MRAKPDLQTGQRFGKLVVIGKGDRVPYRKSSVQLWNVQCDCGNVISVPRNAFERKASPQISCGCEKKRRAQELGRRAAKPDITGQRFGMLTALGPHEVVYKHGKSRRLWSFQCDCGIEARFPRNEVERNGRKSCGCLGKIYRKTRVNNKRKCIDITGQRFDSLVAIKLTGQRDRSNKPTWLMQCDCGKTSEWSKSRLQIYANAGNHINCGDRSQHEWGLRYPPTPNPYPKEAGELAAKYLYFCRTNLKKNSAAIEDEKRDRLLRACWILTYRRSQGEEFSELHERRFIAKHLAFCSVHVFWKYKLEESGGQLDTMFGITKKIGGQMTNATLQDYPVSESETLGNNILPTIDKPRRLKFKKC